MATGNETPASTAAAPGGGLSPTAAFRSGMTGDGQPHQQPHQQQLPQGGSSAVLLQMPQLRDQAVQLLNDRQWAAVIRLLTPAVSAAPCPSATHPAATTAAQAHATPATGAAATAPYNVPSCATGSNAAASAAATGGASRPVVDRVLMQLMALAWVHHYGAKKEWRTLLRLPAQPAAAHAAQSSAEQYIGAGARLDNAGTGQLSAGQVRQQYRLMSTLVHPDKCQGLACADEAFVLLSHAQQHLLDALGRKRRAQEPAGSGRRRQRQRTSDVAGAQDSSDGDGWSDGGAEEEDGFQWWDRWDLPRDAELFPSTEPSAEEEADSSLWEMSLQDLTKEVQVRQRLVLAPKGQENLTIHERQRRLRAARSVLSQRMSGKLSDHVAPGGFLQNGASFTNRHA